MDEKIPETQLLYVEGSNDKWVVISLLEEYGHKDIINVQNIGSCEQAINAFELKVSNPVETERIGLIVDADDKIDKRCKGIVKAFENNGITITDDELMQENGFVADVMNQSGATIKVGVWIMPNNNDEGMLEDFLFNKIETDNVLFACVEPVLQDLEDKATSDSNLKNLMYKPVHRKKAKIHSYMSWSNPPDLSMGMAIHKKIFSRTSEEEKLFKAWLCDLYQFK